ARFNLRQRLHRPPQPHLSLINPRQIHIHEHIHILHSPRLRHAAPLHFNRKLQIANCKPTAVTFYKTSVPPNPPLIAFPSTRAFSTFIPANVNNSGALLIAYSSLLGPLPTETPTI